MANAKKQPGFEVRINVILVLMTLWMGASLIAVWGYFLRDAPQVGLSARDMALGWLGVAGIIGFAMWGIGFGLPRGNGVRRVAVVPIWLTFLMAGLVLSNVV